MNKCRLLVFLLTLAITVSDLAQTSSSNQHRLDPAKLQGGDIVFIRSHTERADMIAKLTNSQFTHCGIVFLVGGQWTVYEGAGRRTTYYSVDKWQEVESLHDGAGHVITLESISVRRLKEMDKWSADDKAKYVAALQLEAKKLHETCYDFGFAWNNHYVLKGGNCIYTSNSAASEYVYCSELVQKALERALNISLVTPKTIGSYHLDQSAIAFLNSDNARTERGGKDYDANELVVSPQDLFVSDKLEDVDAAAK